MEKIQNIIKTFLLISLFLLACPASTRAASFYFSPDSGPYQVGQTISLSIYISSEDQAMNGASGRLLFPVDTLEAVSLSKTNSIFNFWVQEPSFSNITGLVDFEGIVLNPGFRGDAGKVVTINFRVKASGYASLNFSSGTILANDGRGTDILKSLDTAEFTLGTALQNSSPAVANASLPEAPIIISQTHPDQNKVYNLRDVKFTWAIPDGVTGVRLLYDRISNSVPTIVYVPVITEKSLYNMRNGTWYFHVQFRNKTGWGEVSHYKFQINNQLVQSVSTSTPGEVPALFDVVSEPIKSRVAPGEFLPVSVRLSNFGSNKRIDVTVNYSVISSVDDEVYSTHETVAVETTASFIKTILIPYNSKPGAYIVKVSVDYEGQLAPATSQFYFMVERKIFTLFQSTFILYAGITVIIAIIMILLGRLLIRRYSKTRTGYIDYSHVPHDKRTFYEIISDTIMQMRDRVGDDALFIASSIPGLRINSKTGKVLALTLPPAKIMADLVSEYDKLLGKKVSVSLRRDKKIFK